MEPPLTPADRLTAALIAVPVLVDAVHGVLNAIFRPFSGLFDDALHTLHALGVPAVLAGILLAGWRLVGVAWARRACLHPAWLVGLLSFQTAYSLALPIRDAGASAYRPMFPEFVSGLAVAALLPATAGPALEHRRVRAVVALQLVAWAVPPILVDAVWWIERGERGTSWIWGVPGLSGIVNPVALALLYASDPLMGAYGIELNHWPPGRAAWFAGYGLVLAAGCLTVPLRQWARGAVVWVAGMLLFARAVEWSGFIAD